jgi:GrpB-like predicted nucleotidyltransferase (UPF0157 family)
MWSVDEPVELHAYDARWPRLFEAEAAETRGVLGESALGLEHIGSTAVPGLMAKPIVDLMVGVADLETSEEVVSLLQSVGYEDCGALEGRRYLRKRGHVAFNVQIVEHGGARWTANLLFRDYLRSEREAAQRYAEDKQIAIAQAPMLLAYSEAKKSAIEALLARAAEWQRQRPR